jgi:hypothetical protein
MRDLAWGDAPSSYLTRNPDRGKTAGLSSRKQA